MNLQEKMELFIRMDSLIGRKGTGTPKKFASRLSISERSLYGHIRKLKEMGGPIYFCPTRNSYCYKYDVTFSIGFLPSTVDISKSRGGKKVFLEEYFVLQNFCSHSIYI